MKKDIEWHERAVSNTERSLQQDIKNLDMQNKTMERRKAELALYQAQLELAKKEGKDGFDSERYAIKRLCV